MLDLGRNLNALLGRRDRTRIRAAWAERQSGVHQHRRLTRTPIELSSERERLVGVVQAGSQVDARAGCCIEDVGRPQHLHVAQAPDQPLAIVQRMQQRRSTPVVARCRDDIANHNLRGAEQVERCGLAPLVARGLEER